MVAPVLHPVTPQVLRQGFGCERRQLAGGDDPHV